MRDGFQSVMYLAVGIAWLLAPHPLCGLVCSASLE